MKQLLSLLLCYILLTSQVFAISGGPTFGGRGVINPVGTYSGLIQITHEYNNDSPKLDPNTGLPILDPTTGTFVPAEVANPNAIGLFSLSVPTTDVARGSDLIFVEGVVYTGAITASVDPDTGKLSGILNATFNYTVVTSVDAFGDVVTTNVTAQANGKITAQVAATRQGAQSSARLNGSATVQVALGSLDNQVGSSTLNFHVDRTLQCTVTGFRQSTTASTVASFTTTTGT